MLTSSDEPLSVCSQGPDSVLWQKRQVFTISLLVRKRWKRLPETYFAPLLRAAVYEADPSFNQDFLRPALRAFGYRRVQEELLRYLEQGTPREQAGALRAWYWAWKPCLAGRPRWRRAIPDHLAYPWWTGRGSNRRLLGWGAGYARSRLCLSQRQLSRLGLLWQSLSGASLFVFAHYASCLSSQQRMFIPALSAMLLSVLAALKILHCISIIWPDWWQTFPMTFVTVKLEGISLLIMFAGGYTLGGEASALALPFCPENSQSNAERVQIIVWKMMIDHTEKGGSMRKQPFALWFRIVSVMLMLFGILYVFVGLKILPVQRNILVDWESVLYGALMIGWSATLLLIGRIAFQRNDQELKRALLIGLLVWLAIEAAASVWFGVWFNVGVDTVVFALFLVPLLRR